MPTAQSWRIFKPSLLSQGMAPPDTCGGSAATDDGVPRRVGEAPIARKAILARPDGVFARAPKVGRLKGQALISSAGKWR